MTVLFVLKVWAISQHTEKDYTFRNEKLSIRIFFIQHHHQLILQTFDFSNFATSRSSWKESPSCAYSLWSFWSLPLRFWRRLWRKWRRPGTKVCYLWLPMQDWQCPLLCSSPWWPRMASTLSQDTPSEEVLHLFLRFIIHHNQNMINVIFLENQNSCLCFFLSLFIISLRYSNPHLLNIQLIQEDKKEQSGTVILAPISGERVDRFAFLLNTSTSCNRIIVAPTSVAGQGGDAARDYDMTHGTAVYM